MEFICKFPSIPSSIEGLEVLSFFGESSVLSSCISLYTSSPFQAEHGLNFYKYGQTLILSFSTDALPFESQISGLSKLFQLSTTTVYAVSLSQINKMSENNLSISKFSMSHLKNQTVSELDIVKDCGDPSVTTCKYLGAGLKSQNSFSESLFVKKKPINKECFEKYASDFSKNLDFADLNFSPSDLNDKISQFKPRFKEIGAEDLDSEELLKMLLRIMQNFQQKSRSYFSEAKEEVVKHIFENFNVKPSTTSKFIFTKYFDEVLIEYQETPIPEENFNCEWFVKMTINQFGNFLTGKKPHPWSQFEDFLNRIFKEFKYKIELLKKNGQSEVKHYFKALIVSPKQYEVRITVKKINPSELVWKSENFISFNSELPLELTQVVYIGDSFLFLLEDKLGNQSSVYHYSENQLVHIINYQERIRIVEGSDLNRLLIIKLSQKILVKRTSSNNSETVFPQPFENSSEIFFPSYIRNLNQMIFLDSNKQIFLFNLTKRVVRKINIDQQVEKIFISENQKFIGLKIKKLIFLFNLRFEEIFQCQSDCFYFFIAEKDGLKILLFEDNIVKRLSFNDSVARTKNPIKLKSFAYIDLIFHSLFVNGQKIRVYSQDSQFEKNLCDHFDFLTQIFPSVDLKILENFESSKIQENFFQKVYENYFVKIAEFKDFNLIPYSQNKNFYQEILTESPNFYDQVLDFIDLKLLEFQVGQASSIKVLGFIGEEPLAKFICKAFKTNLSQELDNGVWVGFFTYGSVTFVCFYSKLSENPIDNIKCFSFFLSVCDALVLEYNNDLKDYPGILKFSQNRITRKKSSLPRIDIVALDQTKYSSIRIFGPNSFFSKFSNNPLLFYREIDFFLSSFVELSSKWQGKNLVVSIKHVLTQLYLDDDFPLESRILLQKPDVELKKEIHAGKHKLSVKSFQILTNLKSKRCRKKCPGCSVFCSLERNHQDLHFSRIHRINQNPFMTHKKESHAITCDMECLLSKLHDHREPCTKLCGEQGFSNRKHQTEGKAAFDISDNIFHVDLIECKDWWTYKGWRLS